MAVPNNLYEFIVYAKNCVCRMTCEYVTMVNYGEDGTELMNKIQLIDSYILEIENYFYPKCDDYYYQGMKNIRGRKVIMSKNNSLYLESRNKRIQAQSSELNCLTEEEICELASRIKGICINC